MQAVSDGKLEKEHVPKVHLHATHDAALKEVEYKDLRQYSAASEAGNSNRQEAHHNPASGGTSVAKESKEIGSHGRSIDMVRNLHQSTDILQTSRTRQVLLRAPRRTQDQYQTRRHLAGRKC